MGSVARSCAEGAVGVRFRGFCIIAAGSLRSMRSSRRCPGGRITQAWCPTVLRAWVGGSFRDGAAEVGEPDLPGWIAVASLALRKGSLRLACSGFPAGDCAAGATRFLRPVHELGKQTRRFRSGGESVCSWGAARRGVSGFHGHRFQGEPINCSGWTRRPALSMNCRSAYQRRVQA